MSECHIFKMRLEFEKFDESFVCGLAIYECQFSSFIESTLTVVPTNRCGLQSCGLSFS
jgi:hypothetical protein